MATMSQEEVVAVDNEKQEGEVIPHPTPTPIRTQTPNDSAFTLFVTKALKKIQTEIRSRASEYRALRQACQEVVDGLSSGSIQFSAPLEDEACNALLEPLLLACKLENARIQETALGCLHKCIAHAWLQGESTNDPENVVTSVITSISRCGENPSAKVQLSVVKALLTACTAEHFVPHSEALMSAVRTLFNLAVGSDEVSIQRTARSALLQIMHTVCKRISTPDMFSTPQTTPKHSLEFTDSMQPKDFSEDLKGDPISFSISGETPQQQPQLKGKDGEQDGEENEEQQEEDEEQQAGEGEQGEDSTPQAKKGVDAALRVAKLACLAEQGDLQGLEAALSAEDERTPNHESTQQNNQPNGKQDGQIGELQMTQSNAVSGSLSNGDNQHSKKPEISILERDVLSVIRSLCKLAEREGGTGMVEVYMAEGKLLALELLVKMFLNPSKESWNHGSARFYRELRKPLCLTLLKNSLGGDDQVYYWTVRLFLAILLLPKLRLGLKAELGAFLPLLVLRPLETGSTRPQQVTSAIQILQRICSEPQLLVDLFVNFDCEYNAGNLYERMVKVLARLAQDGEMSSSRQEEINAVKGAAASALITVVNSIDAWAGPIRDATQLNLERIGSGKLGSDETGDFVSEVNRLEQAKSKKESYAAAIALFNRNGVKGMQALIRGEHLAQDPKIVAKFIKDSLLRNEINREQVGEYFGYHEEFQIAVMHAFIDLEKYEKITIDVALRTLLGKFKIPGEAQKIDRISEKFAAKYCNDNPGVFKNVDAAYMLTFAIIMLNTDAHNPVAEKRLTAESFILMNQNPETEEYALPIEDLTGIFERVVAEEIIIQGEDSYSSSLAAAMGQTWLALPFKIDNVWDKNFRAQQAEQRYVAESKVAMRQSGRWQSGSDAENVRPMLQVSGTSILEGLRATMRDAVSLTLVRQTLDSLARLSKLSSMLNLYQLCDAAVSTMADNTGVFEPAPANSFAEQRQLMSLKSIVELGSGKEAALLGNAWGVVLNCLSALEILSQRLGEDINAAANDQSPNNPVNKLLTVIGYGSGSVSASTTPTSPSSLGRLIRGGNQGNSQAGGQLLVKWSRGEGSAAVDRVYATSGELDGDAVLIFVKQLVSISATELKTGQAQVFSLQKLVECVYHNLGRIRLVWSRIWQLVCPHLVSSACLPKLEVGLYAVDSLKQLVGKLLSRQQLVDFSFQEELLSPFVDVLRYGPLPEVRELALQCVQQILESHSKALDSKGCLVLLKVLTVASADMSALLLRHLLLPVQVMLAMFGQDPQQIGSQHLAFLLRLMVVGCHNPEVGSNFLRLFPQCLVRVKQLGDQECGSELLEGAMGGLEEGERINVLVLERDVVLNWFPEWMTWKDPWLCSLGAMADVASQVQLEPTADEAAQSLFMAVDTYGAASDGWQDLTWQGVVKKVLCPWLGCDDQQLDKPWQHARLRKHAAIHLPHFFMHLTAFYPKIQWHSLVLLVQLVLQYIWSQQLQTAMLGINLIKNLALSIGSKLDGKGWNVLLCGLKLATLYQKTDKCVEILTFAATTKNSISETDFSKLVKSNLEIDDDNQQQQFRHRCHVELMMLRCLNLIHEGCNSILGVQTELELLFIIQQAVNSAANFSIDIENEKQNSDNQMEYLPSLSTHYKLQSDQFQQEQKDREIFEDQDQDKIEDKETQIQEYDDENSKNDSSEVQIDDQQQIIEENDGQDNNSEEFYDIPEKEAQQQLKQQQQQQEEKEKSEEQQQQLQLQKSLSGKSLPTDEFEDGTTRLRTTKASDKSQQLLIRQLVEGGLLLLKMMKRTLQEKDATNVSKERREKVKQQLVQFCQKVLRNASCDFQWQSSNVSALIVQVLQVSREYKQIAGFQDLSLLIKSGQQDVREQLSQLFNSLYMQEI